MSELDFTGERMVPGRVDSHLEFEHVSRYRFAAAWVEGRTVVDLGTGEGYGAAVLAAAGAKSVLGLDIAPDAILHARQRYGCPGLGFAVADCGVACVAGGAADLITAFELIEHVANYRGLLRAAREMLAPEGLFLVSTPNREVYAEHRQGEPNPFHVVEFDREELARLLGEFFPRVVLLGQSTTEGALFRPFEPEVPGAAVPPPASDGPSPAEPDYLVAVCGFDESVGRAARAGFIPSSDNLLRLHNRRIGSLQQELEERTRWATSMATESDERGRRVLELQTELEERTRWARQLEADLQGSSERERRLEERTTIARKLRRETAERDRQFLLRLRELEALQERVRRLEIEAEGRAGSLDDLEVRIEEADDRSFGNQALLRWQRDSAVRLAERIETLEQARRGDAVRIGHLDDASYQHQIGLDYHSTQIAALGEGLVGLESQSRRQEQVLQEASVLVARTAATVDGLLASGLWQAYARASAAARRLLGRAEPGGRAAARSLEGATAGIAPSRRPRISLLLLVDGDAEPALRSLESFGRQQGCAYEVVVAGASLPVSLAAALRTNRRLRYVGCRGSASEAIGRGLRAARGERVLLARSGVVLAQGAVCVLDDSLDTLPDCGLVGPRLVDEGEELVAFGGALDAEGRPHCLGAGADWDGLRYSYAQPTAFAPGVCLMGDRHLLRNLAQGTGIDLSLAGAVELAARARRLGAQTYVQPGTSAVCDSSIVAGLAGASIAARRAGDGDPEDLALPKRPRILVVDHRLPTPDQDSGSVRMRNLLTILQDLGFAITFLPENLKATPPYSDDLQRAGIEVIALPWAPSAQGFIEQRGGTFDCALVSRCHIAAELMTPIRAALGDKPIVFDTVDLQFLREGRRARLEGGAEAKRAEALKTLELDLARQADTVLVVSPFEQRLLESELPATKVRLVSNIHQAVGNRRGFRGRRGIFFLGGFEHPPNLDAAEWLVEEIVPLIRREMPDLQVHVVGSNPTAKVRALASDSVTIAGWVQDLAPYLDGCRLSIAPLRYGAGVKGKVNLSLAHGVPCVATSVAAEGMGLVSGRDVLIADSAADFAAAVVRLHRSPWLWRRLSRNGVRNIDRRFSPDVARKALRALFEELGIATAEATPRRRSAGRRAWRG